MPHFNIKEALKNLRGLSCPCGCGSGEFSHDGRLKWDFGGVEIKKQIIEEFEKLQKELRAYRHD